MSDPEYENTPAPTVNASITYAVAREHTIKRHIKSMDNIITQVPTTPNALALAKTLKFMLKELQPRNLDHE